MPSDALRRLALHALLLALSGAALFLYSAHGALPYNPVKLPFESSLRVSRVLPQGWGFFTKSPRDETLTAHRVLEDGSLTPLSRGPHSRMANAFGMNRRSRSEGVEMGLLAAAVRKKQKDPWVGCDDGEARCVARLARDGRFIRLQSIAPEPSLCGRLVLKLQRPVPWAWSRSVREMPFRLLPLEVAC
jgi:antimicrobial peptide system SdpA family protein